VKHHQYVLVSVLELCQTDQFLRLVPILGLFGQSAVVVTKAIPLPKRAHGVTAKELPTNLKSKDVGGSDKKE
jgi:hypothetical protein